MYKSNYHSHCVFCDGRSPMEDFVKTAISLGLKKYGFSSHGPIPFETQWTMKEENFPYYQLEFSRLKEKYKNEIDLYIGLEVDFIPGYSSVENEFYRDKSFDYLIGSVHYIDKIADEKYMGIDGAFTDFEKGLNLIYGGDIQAISKRYYEILKMMIEIGGFDIVGHLDKISYHGTKYPDFDIRSKWYEQLMGETLQLIKDKGIIVEINTKSLLERGITFPHQHFYPLMNELKIPITVNSDCHYIDKITEGFDLTFTFLKKAGFNSVQQLTEGKWQAVEF